MDASTVLFTCNAFGFDRAQRHLFFTLCGLADADGHVNCSRARLQSALGMTGYPSWITGALLRFADVGAIELNSTGDVGETIECSPKLVQFA